MNKQRLSELYQGKCIEYTLLAEQHYHLQKDTKELLNQTVNAKKNFNELANQHTALQDVCDNQHKELAANRVEIQAYQNIICEERSANNECCNTIRQQQTKLNDLTKKNTRLSDRNYQLVKANRIYFIVGTAGTIIGFLLGWLVV